MIVSVTETNELFQNLGHWFRLVGQDKALL